MRSFKQTFAMLDQGLRPCQRPGCRDYGNTIHYKHGIVCRRHSISVDDQPGGQLALFSTRPYDLSH
jgi:hypothetical protein